MTEEQHIVKDERKELRMVHMAGDKSIKWRPVQIGALVEAKQMLPPICKTLVDIILATTVQPFIITDNEKSAHWRGFKYGCYILVHGFWASLQLAIFDITQVYQESPIGCRELCQLMRDETFLQGVVGSVAYCVNTKYLGS